MASGNFGERLKRERELREVTLQEITSATRIGPRFLEALENEDWEKLPGGVFNRGFVRSIARYLGLDEEALLGDYELAYAAQATPLEKDSDPIPPSAPRWLPAMMVLCILVLVAGLIVGGVYAWRHFAAGRNAKPASAATTSALPRQGPQPAASVVSTAAEIPVSTLNAPIDIASGPLELLVSASRDTHLLVLADSHVAFYDVVHSGENRHFTAKEGFEVTAADSGAVLLELNGVAMPPLGVPGSSGTITLSHENLRQASGGNTEP